MSDGLTVPFALAAGLSGSLSSTSVVLTAGMSEVAAGAIAMGLGGYLAARTDFEHYLSERKREMREIREVPQQERKEVIDIFRQYGLADTELTPIIKALETDPVLWTDFMMRFELGMEPPDPKRALWSALTIAFSYVGGGLIPLFPYTLFQDLSQALLVSTIVTLLALFIFGFTKGLFTGAKPWQSGAQTVFVGGLAATAAFGIARLIH